MTDDDQAGNGGPSRYVKLNVGGTLFYTTAGSLAQCETLAKAALKDDEGCIIIDRCGKHFETILDFLRDGSVPLPDNSKDVAELLVEAQYYKVDELVRLCTNSLTKERENTELICRVPLVTSKREAQLLIRTTKKPVVKLLFNRHNNKYSYTSTSDDNLLKNLELFDRLSLKFSGQMLFVKDVDELSQEICCWSFYRCGKTHANICCTSTVYETDKMYTKVECPETRINEEADLILQGRSCHASAS